MPVVKARRQVSTNPLPAVRKHAAETDISAGAGVEQAKAQKGDAIAQLGARLRAWRWTHRG